MKRILRKDFVERVIKDLGLSECGPDDHYEDGVLRGMLPSGRKIGFIYYPGEICLFYGQRILSDPSKDQENPDFLDVKKVLFSLFGVTATEDIPKTKDDHLNEIFDDNYLIMAWLQTSPVIACYLW